MVFAAAPAFGPFNVSSTEDDILWACDKMISVIPEAGKFVSAARIVTIRFSIAWVGMKASCNIIVTEVAALEAVPPPAVVVLVVDIIPIVVVVVGAIDPVH